MFSLREFVKDGFLKAVGKMADHQIILNSAGYHEKGVLCTEDLVEIQNALRAKERTAEGMDDGGTDRLETAQETAD